MAHESLSGKDTVNMNAIVFVDVQKDFIDGALCSKKAQELTPYIVDAAKLCKANGYRLYATMDTHGKDYRDTLEGRRLPVAHCVEGTEGWFIDDRLAKVLDGNCTIVQKRTFGSLDLAEVIAEDFRDGGLEEIVLCGFCTDICVISNALLLRARFPNVKIAIVSNLCAGTTEAAHEAALKVAESCQIDVVLNYENCR